MKFQILSALLLALSAVASPLTASTVELVAVPFASGSVAAAPMAATITARPGAFTFIKAGTTTSANIGFQALEARQFGAPGDGAPSLVMCSSTDCDLSEFCTFVYIPETYSVCYENADYFYSSFIYSQSGEGFGFGVYIAEPGCENPAQLPVVNTCYNYLINGEISLSLDFYFID